MKSAIFAAMLSVAMAQRGYDPHYSPQLPHGRAPHHAPHREYAPPAHHNPHQSEAVMRMMRRPRSAFHDPLNRMNVNKPLGRAFDSKINLHGE